MKDLDDKLLRYTSTNLKGKLLVCKDYLDMFKIEDRVCIDCNDHKRHESIRYRYPKMLST